MSLKWKDWKPSIKEIDYVGADWEDYKGLQFEGYASTSDMDRTNDVVLPEAFQKSINTYMENPIIFLQHNSSLPIGSVIEADIDSKWLWIKWIVKADKENIFQDLRTWVIKTMSFWYRVNKYEIKEKKQGKTMLYYNEIQELELFEISLVSVPMNPKAKIKSKEELLGKNLSDEEYATYFQTSKEDEYPLFKSIADVMIKFKDIKKAKKAWDECETEDWEEWELEDDGDGNLVCKMKKKKEAEEVIEEVEEVVEEEKMQLDTVVELPPTPKTEEKPEITTEEVQETVEEVIKEEEKVEEKVEETPAPVVEEEKPAEVVPETVETPEIIPENDDWKIIETPKEEEVVPENETPEATPVVLEEKVDEIEKQFSKSLDEIGKRFEKVEWLDTIVKDFKEAMQVSFKELKAEQNQFKKEVDEVVSWCVDIVNILAKNFKNFCVDSGLNFAEHKESSEEKKVKELMKTPLAQTLVELKN